MVCAKIKNGYDQCVDKHPRRWIPRVVLVNISDLKEIQRTKYGIYFKLIQIGGVGNRAKGFAFEYLEVSNQVLANAEAVNKNNYKQWRHNVQLPMVDFANFEVLDAINKGEYFAALIDADDRVWIFGVNFGLQPDDYLFVGTDFTTLTLRSANLEDSPPLRYLGPSIDFWNNFESAELSELGDFNDDFNDDFY